MISLSKEALLSQPANALVIGSQLSSLWHISLSIIREVSVLQSWHNICNCASDSSLENCWIHSDGFPKSSLRCCIFGHVMDCEHNVSMVSLVKHLGGLYQIRFLGSIREVYLCIYLAGFSPLKGGGEVGAEGRLGEWSLQRVAQSPSKTYTTSRG